MFSTEHFEGRIQFIEKDLVCINLHYNSKVDPNTPYVGQILLNKSTGEYYLPSLCFSPIHGLVIFDQLLSIVNQCKEILTKLKV